MRIIHCRIGRRSTAYPFSVHSGTSSFASTVPSPLTPVHRYFGDVRETVPGQQIVPGLSVHPLPCFGREPGGSPPSRDVP